MNYKQLPFTILSFVFLFIFNSCNVEPVDPLLSIQLSNPSSGGGTTGGGTTGGGTTGGGTTSTYYVRAQVDGVQKEWNMCSAQFDSNLNLMISGADSASSTDYTAISLSIVRDISTNAPPIATGVYPLSFFANCGFLINSTNDSYSSTYDPFTFSPGNITITQIDFVNKTIKGTFSFIGKNPSLVTKQFTNGEFFVNYL
jgi:hypothetical protein